MSSDEDFKAVYLEPTETLFKIFIPERMKNSVCNTKLKPDINIHEIGKFCSLLAKGNFEVISCLYIDNEKFGNKKYAFESEEWIKLKEMRKLFITCTCLNVKLIKFNDYIHNSNAAEVFNLKWISYCNLI